MRTGFTEDENCLRIESILFKKLQSRLLITLKDNKNIHIDFGPQIERSNNIKARIFTNIFQFPCALRGLTKSSRLSLFLNGLESGNWRQTMLAIILQDIACPPVLFDDWKLQSSQ